MASSSSAAGHPRVRGAANIPRVPPGYSTLYDSGRPGILALVPPETLYPERPEDRCLRSDVRTFFELLSSLIRLVVVEDIDCTDRVEKLRDCIKCLNAGKKLKQRLIYRLEDVKVACAYRKQLKQKKLHEEVYQKKLAGIEKELRRLGTLN